MGAQQRELPQYVKDDLYQVQRYLDRATRERLGLMMKVPVFIKEPRAALENPLVGIQEIVLRLEPGMGDGPTSSRVAVVDFNFNSQRLVEPVAWDGDVGWFREPAAAHAWLPVLPRRSERNYRQLIDQAIENPYYHQVNAWAVVQRVLEFFEEPWALEGRCRGVSTVTA